MNSVIVSRDPDGALAVTAVPDAASVPGQPALAAPAPAASGSAAPGSAAPAPGPSAPSAPVPAAPTPSRPTPRGGVPAGFGALAGVAEPARAPAAAAMPVISAPADPSAASRPTGLVVPGSGLRAGHLDDLATDPTGALQVPADPQELGWFTGGAVPGQTGPAVVVGHVDSWQGPGVFWRLHELHAGDPVDVLRSDGTTAHFVVDSVESFDKGRLPHRARLRPHARAVPPSRDLRRRLRPRGPLLHRQRRRVRLRGSLKWTSRGCQETPETVGPSN